MPGLVRLVCGFASATLTKEGRQWSGGTEVPPDSARAEQYDLDYRRFLAMVRHRDELRGMA
jgi:hypothetical protein